MALQSGAALLPAERRVVASLAAIYATRLFGLFLLAQIAGFIWYVIESPHKERVSD